jgi:hypothetical protein
MRSPGLWAGVVWAARVVAGVTGVDGHPRPCLAQRLTPARSSAEQIASGAKALRSGSHVRDQRHGRSGVGRTDPPSGVLAPNVTGWDRETAVAEPLNQRWASPPAAR